MKALSHTDPPDLQRIWRPSVLATLAYAFLFAILVLWILCTFQVNQIHGWIPPSVPGGPSLYHLVSAVHAALVVVLLLDGRAAFTAPPGLRKGQIAGLILALVLVVALQLAAEAMRSAALAFELPR